MNKTDEEMEQRICEELHNWYVTGQISHEDYLTLLMVWLVESEVDE